MMEGQTDNPQPGGVSNVRLRIKIRNDTNVFWHTAPQKGWNEVFLRIQESNRRIPTRYDFGSAQ